MRGDDTKKKGLQVMGALLFWQVVGDALADIRGGGEVEGENCNNERQDDKHVGDEFGFIHNRSASLAKPLLKNSGGVQAKKIE
jgi:hypothetical protein